jgi:dienelactone hydrolase
VIRRLGTLLILALLLVLQTVPASGASSVVYSQSEGGLSGYLAVPKGQGPFPAVVYNHGGLGNKIGGPPEQTAEALARAGFVGFSPM